MPLCVLCGQVTLDTDEICRHHMGGHEDDWATANRVMCDFLHRGVVRPARLEQDEDLELLVTP